MYAGRIVENATQQQILKNPAHPYSVRLLQSLPSRTGRDRALQVIEGRVPPATQYPDYCRFAERCPWVHEPCRKIDPPNYPVENGSADASRHDAACVLYDEKIQGRKHSPTELQTPPPPRPRNTVAGTGETLIQIDDLKVHFPIRRGVFKKTVGHVKAVDGVTISIKKGQTLALVGESGCGKTTLGKALLQLIRPTAGKVLFSGADLTELSRPELRPYRRRLQIIFQDPYSSLDPRMMIGEIIEEGMEAQGIGRNRHEREERARELLGRVGLDPGVVYRYPHEFSGGQRQRICIARCLAVDPEFIVCDEATSALDVSVQAQILNLLDKLRNELGLTYLFITHNLSAVEYLADEVAVMYLGRIVEYGKTEDVFKSPAHPYTRALLAAVPQIDPASGLAKIKLTGDVPSPVNPPAGCHFNPRCSEVHARCREAYPDSYSVTETHRANCFLYGETAVGVQTEKSAGNK
jgi:peptide/nickel transport system ATP-binding protein